jgi:molybdopterin molybdotransferase
VSVETVWRWIDENAPRLDAEEVALDAAHGRVPAAPPRAAADVPAMSRAVEGGYAVRAEETIGAGPYNPVSCPVVAAGDGLLPRGAVARTGSAGQLPRGADAILPHEAVESEGAGRISILAPIAVGDRVVKAASEFRAGELLWAGERCDPLRPAEVGLLSAAAITRVAVVRQPRTRILIAAGAGAGEHLGLMLHALVERDGGAVIGPARLDELPARAAEIVDGADVVLIVRAVERPLAPIDALVDRDAGLAVRGVAIEPGRETCLARLGDPIIALLPDLPAACFWSYELVAARAVRSKGGRNPGFPFAARRFRTTRKIASALGVTEVVPVRLDPADPGAVVPFPDGPAPRLRNAAAADGFALVPATSEGCAAGSEVVVWLFDPCGQDSAGHA